MQEEIKKTKEMSRMLILDPTIVNIIREDNLAIKDDFGPGMSDEDFDLYLAQNISLQPYQDMVGF